MQVDNSVAVMKKLTPHFSRSEFACKCGCGFDVVDAELLKVLEGIRAGFGKPVTITSGCRCEKHNKQYSGSPKSQHLLGKAADIKVKDTPPESVADYLIAMYPDQYGIGIYQTWVHIDVREQMARW